MPNPTTILLLTLLATPLAATVHLHNVIALPAPAYGEATRHTVFGLEASRRPVFSARIATIAETPDGTVHVSLDNVREAATLTERLQPYDGPAIAWTVEISNGIFEGATFDLLGVDSESGALQLDASTVHDAIWSLVTDDDVHTPYPREKNGSEIYLLDRAEPLQTFVGARLLIRPMHSLFSVFGEANKVNLLPGSEADLAETVRILNPGAADAEMFFYSSALNSWARAEAPGTPSGDFAIQPGAVISVKAMLPPLNDLDSCRTTYIMSSDPGIEFPISYDKWNVIAECDGSQALPPPNGLDKCRITQIILGTTGIEFLLN